MAPFQLPIITARSHRLRKTQFGGAQRFTAARTGLFFDEGFAAEGGCGMNHPTFSAACLTAWC
jgi:hypothetical protein